MSNRLALHCTAMHLVIVNGLVRVNHWHYHATRYNCTIVTIAEPGLRNAYYILRKPRNC